MRIENPIFIIGTGRCGSTVVAEALCHHPSLGWFSNYNAYFPSSDLASILPRVYDLPLLTRMRRAEKRQYEQGKGALNRFLPRPDEAYQKWERLCGRKFRSEFLLGQKAGENEIRLVRRSVQRLLRLQNKPTFTAKFTGPPRIEYLLSIFPKAKFIQVVRDPRAVIMSLLKVDFWTEGNGMLSPRWHGGLCDNWLAEWESYGRSSFALTAIQVRSLLDAVEAERRLLGHDQFLKVRFEEFVANPVTAMSQVQDFCELAKSVLVHKYVKRSGRYRETNMKYIERMTAEQKLVAKRILGDHVQGRGYD